jgi:hypothetical protein
MRCSSWSLVLLLFLGLAQTAPAASVNLAWDDTVTPDKYMVLRCPIPAGATVCTPAVDLPGMPIPGTARAYTDPAASGPECWAVQRLSDAGVRGARALAIDGTTPYVCQQVAAAVPPRLRFTTQPQSTAANQPLPPVVVQAQDVSGILEKSFTQPITLILLSDVGVVPFAHTTLVSVDSVSSVAPATGAIDGNPATKWHTAYTPKDPANVPYPHVLTVNLGTSYPVNGIRYLPRQDGEVNGTIAQYEVYVSADGSTWGTAVASGTFASNTTMKTVMFAEKTGQYVRLKGLSEINGNPWASVAEFTTLYTAATGSCPGRLVGPPTQQASGGQASFPDLSVSAPGTACQLMATAGGLTGDTSATFAITGGVLPPVLPPPGPLPAPTNLREVPSE